jgi:hypothetical protein
VPEDDSSVSNYSEENENVIKDLFTTKLFKNLINTKDKRILLVDDEPYNLIGLKIVLEAADEYGVVSKLID